MSTYLFSFKPQFAPLVEAGTKLQTVRAVRKDGRMPVAGDVAKLYVGLRTKAARLLMTVPIVASFPVAMVFEPWPARGIFILGHRVENDEFARLDGFADVGAMLDWFEQVHRGRPFEGFCVRWLSSLAVERRRREPAVVAP